MECYAHFAADRRKREFELHAKFFASSPRTHSYFLLGKEGRKGMEGQVMSYKRQYVTSGPEWAAEEAGEECEEDMPWRTSNCEGEVA